MMKELNPQLAGFKVIQSGRKRGFFDGQTPAAGDIVIVPRNLLPTFRVEAQDCLGDLVISAGSPLPDIPDDSGWAMGVVPEPNSPLLRDCRRWLGNALVPVIIAGCLYLLPVGVADVRAATFNVTTSAELSTAITTANSNAEDDTININGSIVLTAELPLIDSNIVFEGNSNTVSGNNAYRVFFVKSGTVEFRDITISSGLAKGGDGKFNGGGGAGLGGGLFVYGGSVTVRDSLFSGNEARGGNGAASSDKDGGGGGMGGDGDVPAARNYTGGGGGLYTTDDAVEGTGGGANSGSYNSSGIGGAGGFGGGGGGGWAGGGAGGFGGGGGAAANSWTGDYVGGNGGFGGGGGSGGSIRGSGGEGGFGGGGGGSKYGTGGISGNYGGNGASSSGGGGGGVGGAVFAMNGTSKLTNVTFSSNATTAGTGTHNGSIAGNDVFICTEAICGTGNVATVDACGTTSTTELAGGSFGNNCLPPTMTLDTDSLSYTENDLAQQISPTATVTGEESNFDGGTLTAQITGNAETADQLSITETGGVTLSVTSVLVDGVSRATAAASSVTGGTVLTITFNSTATASQIETILQAVGYENTSDNPGTSDRTVTFVVTDDGGNSDTGTRDISVTAVNDAPTGITLSNTRVDENMPVNTVIGILSTTDPDD